MQGYTIPDTTSGASDAAGALALVFICGFYAVAIGIAILIYWKIFSKAGYSGWLSLLMLVPLVNLGMMFFLAFGDWPVLRELRELRGQGGYMRVPPPTGPPPTSQPPMPPAAPAPPVAGAPTAPPTTPQAAPPTAPPPGPPPGPPPA